MLFTMPADRLSDGEMRHIMETYGTQMKRVCYLYLKDLSLAEDAAQEAFIKIYKRGASFRGNCAEKTWIMRVTVNVCRDMLRTPWLRHTDRTRTPEMLSHPSSVSDDGFAVTDAVMGLSPKYREVIILRYYQEMNVSEISRSLGISRYIVTTRIKTAQNLLRKQLEGWYFDEPQS